MYFISCANKGRLNSMTAGACKVSPPRFLPRSRKHFNPALKIEAGNWSNKMFRSRLFENKTCFSTPGQKSEKKSQSHCYAMKSLETLFVRRSQADTNNWANLPQRPIPQMRTYRHRELIGHFKTD